MRHTDHAERAAASRSIPLADVIGAAQERLDAHRIAVETADAAVLVGYTDDGWQGFSNGNVVWAIIRDGVLATVMFRREDQPSTPAALRVRTVIA